MIMRVTKRTKERQPVHEAILPLPRRPEKEGPAGRTYTNWTDVWPTICSCGLERSREGLTYKEPERAASRGRPLLFGRRPGAAVAAG
jgi:hypothetical protein